MPMQYDYAVQNVELIRAERSQHFGLDQTLPWMPYLTHCPVGRLPMQSKEHPIQVP
jgi:hypothetical protein